MAKHLHRDQTITGQVGTLITFLDRNLCIAQATHEESGPSFTDRSSEARTEGGTAFNLLAATTDRFYFGYDSKFPGIRVDLDQAGAGLALVWEYWNGSAWAALSNVAGAAAGLTADGEVTWTIPGDWAKTTVNGGASLYFVRVRTTTHTTTPTAFFVVVNWTIFDDSPGTANSRVYKSIGENGTSTIFVWVNDNAIVGAGLANLKLFESWDAGTDIGTNPAPTAAQQANGLVHRKSSTADATNRPISIAVSRDRFVLMSWPSVTTILAATEAASLYIGKVDSFVSGDAFGQIIMGNAVTNTSNSFLDQGVVGAAGAFASAGHYLLRNFSGGVGAVTCGPHMISSGGGTTDEYPVFPNGADGGLLYIFPPIIEDPNRTFRAVLNGAIAVMHKITGTTFGNQDVFTDSVSGKKFYLFCLALANGITSARRTTPWGGVEYQHISTG